MKPTLLVVYWMQNIPGADNGLSYNGRPLTNWWIFIGDFDHAMQRKMTLLKGLNGKQSSSGTLLLEDKESL